MYVATSHISHDGGLRIQTEHRVQGNIEHPWTKRNKENYNKAKSIHGYARP